MKNQKKKKKQENTQCRVVLNRPAVGRRGPWLVAVVDVADVVVAAAAAAVAVAVVVVVDAEAAAAAAAAGVAARRLAVRRSPAADRRPFRTGPTTPCPASRVR